MANHPKRPEIWRMPVEESTLGRRTLRLAMWKARVFSRAGLATVSAFGLVCSILVMVYCTSYLANLFFFFAASLSFFHLVFSLWKGITKRVVRASDYLYFSLAFCGLVL